MFECPTDLSYTGRHLWARTDRDTSEAAVGMTEHLVEIFDDIESIDLPLVGDELNMDTYCIHVHLPTRIRHLRSPLSGRVLEINRDVLDSASLIHLAPYEHWLYRMEYDEEDETELLMSSSQYLKYLDQL